MNAHRTIDARPRKLLMIAFNFPPLAQSTGRFRTLSFARHLPAHGWRPTVLTARERVYDAVQAASLSEIPDGLNVVRAPGLDVARHLSIAGRYPHWLATPDRWSAWSIGAARAGRRMLERERFDALWVTYPIPSALLAALSLRRASKLPLVLDLRDPIVYENWPTGRWRRRVFSWIERRAVEAASAVVCTTPSACAMYRERYAHLPPQRFCTIANGIEDGAAMDSSAAHGRDGEVAGSGAPRGDDGAALSSSAPRGADEPPSKARLTIVHSGLMELPERDPSALFDALKRLQPEQARRLRIVLRGSNRDAALRAQVERLGIADIVAIEPSVAHAQALAEMRAADALLLFQGRECNRQIPAKAYEYLACRKPIVALVDTYGDTRALVERDWRVPYAADMDDAARIATALARLMDDGEHGRMHVPDAGLIEPNTRRAHTAELAAVLNRVAGG